MSRGTMNALGASARKGLALFWTALLLATLLVPYAALSSPVEVQAAAVAPECGLVPLDVEIILDQSGSMGSNSNAGHTREYWAQQAADQLVTALQSNGGVGTGPATSTGGRHRVGLTTFNGTISNSYPGYTVRASLGSQDASAIETTINGLSASGNTPTKAGMAGGAADLTAHQRSTDFGLTVRHIILFISDGRPNPDGPSSGWGNGTSQRPTQADANTFDAAADEVFSIAIGQGGSGSSAVDTALMQALAKPADGTHYANVVDSSQLPSLFAGIFQTIACKTTPTMTTSVSSDTVDFGGTVHDTATLTGDGSHDVTGTVDFALCGPTANPADCTSPTITVGSAPVSNGSATSPDYTVGQTAAASGYYCFEADYTPDTAAGTYYNSASHTAADSECFYVAPATIKLTKVADDSSVDPGATVGYTVTISNTGGSTALGVSVTDTLPSNGGLQWSLDPSSDAGWSINSTTLSFSGSVGAGKSASAHITSPTTQATCGTIDNSASATSTSDGSTSVGPVSISVTCATLSWQKQDENNQALGGATFTVSPNPFDLSGTGSIDVTDNSAPDQAAAAGSFELVNVVPGTYTITEKTPPAGYLVDPTVQQITVKGGDNGVADSPWTDVMARPGLGITKSVDPGSITGGTDSSVAYTIVVSNSGTAATSGDVLVTDNDFPAFYSISDVQCSVSVATCDAADLAVGGIDLGQMTAGESVTITVSGTASPNNTTDIGDNVNTAYACEQVVDSDPVCLPAQATLTVTLAHSSAIHILKTPSTTVTPIGGGQVTYTYTVTNTGNVPLSDVEVSDNKCSSVTYVDGDTSDNGLLDLTETWTFTCTTNLTATTTNVGTATGYDGDSKVSDTATATVTVPVVPPPPPPNPPTPTTPAPTPSATVLATATATARLTLPPTSTLDGSSPTGQSGSGLVLILAAIGLLVLLLGLVAPAPARARQRTRRR